MKMNPLVCLKTLDQTNVPQPSNSHGERPRKVYIAWLAFLFHLIHLYVHAWINEPIKMKIRKEDSQQVENYL